MMEIAFEDIDDEYTLPLLPFASAFLVNMNMNILFDSSVCYEYLSSSLIDRGGGNFSGMREREN
jgi:hypothetical protein